LISDVKYDCVEHTTDGFIHENTEIMVIRFLRVKCEYLVRSRSIKGHIEFFFLIRTINIRTNACIQISSIIELIEIIEMFDKVNVELQK